MVRAHVVTWRTIAAKGTDIDVARFLSSGDSAMDITGNDARGISMMDSETWELWAGAKTISTIKVAYGDGSVLSEEEMDDSPDAVGVIVRSRNAL